MMARFIVLCLVALNVFLVQCDKEANRISPSKNEEPGDPCANPDKTCHGDFVPSDTSRPASCNGSVCKAGFVRNEYGRCVSQELCNRCRGKRHEFYDDCFAHCQPLCNETFTGFCPRMCSGGCVCAAGFIRSSQDGPCVPLVKCPPLCEDKDKEYVMCRSSGDPVCVRYHLGRGACDLRPGCKCRKGFVRRTDRYLDDSCIREEDCPAFKASLKLANK